MNHLNEGGILTDNVIRVRRNGPLLCTGEIEVYDAEGRCLKKSDDLVLCRCGASQNKPFCDGSHKAVNFEAPGHVSDEKPEVLEEPGSLIITVRANAMLIAKGPMRIEGSETGTTTRQKAALCRCGFSGKKPFCDVSHKKCGFLAD